MADETPEQARPEEESKKDTVRINLPPGLTGRSTTPINVPGAPPAARPKPAVPLEDEAKQETAVMGKPAATPKPKSDTSRVQVPAAKPAAPETPRSTVKLRREPEPAGATAAAGPAPAAARAGAPAPSGGDTGLAIVAMVLSIAVAVYLAMQAMS